MSRNVIDSLNMMSPSSVGLGSAENMNAGLNPLVLSSE